MPSDSFAATSIEMLAGGAILLPIGLATTHPHFADFSGRSIFGWFYLVTAGSLVGYTAYVWLLDNAPLGTVATYAYVNPIVAIALGAIVLHESLTWTIGIGAALVLACVALVVRTETVPLDLELAGKDGVHRPVDAPSEPGAVVGGSEHALEREAGLLGDAP
jgi:drug/metabolite transporter (DMT)-like permease